MGREYLADKPTLDEVNSKVGTTGDAASGTSLFAKVNNLLNTLANHAAAWTSARAAKMDNLDAAISSRAPASTALSTAQWTNTRAGYLDKLNNATYGLEAIKNAIGAAAKFDNAIKVTHSMLSSSNTFSGSGKGVLYVFPVASDTSAGVIIDGNSIGTVYGGNGNSEAIKIEFLSSFKVTNNGSRYCYCDAVFY